MKAGEKYVGFLPCPFGVQQGKEGRERERCVCVEVGGWKGVCKTPVRIHAPLITGLQGSSSSWPKAHYGSSSTALWK